LLFFLPPETAHGVGIAALRVLGFVFPVVRPFLSGPRRPVTVGEGPEALTFPNPVGLAAGFDKDGEAVQGLAALGFGFVEVGTVTPRPQPGNPRPRLFRYPEQGALINRMGFNNAGAPALARRLARARPLPIPIGVNIGKNKDTPLEKATGDYLFCLETLLDVADFFVVNVSSPNTPGLRGLQDPAFLEPLLTALRRREEELCSTRRKAKRPLLFVKVSPDDDPGEALVETVVRAGFDGIVASNTTTDRTGFPPGAPADGGASGRILMDKATAVLRRLALAARGRLTLIGVGGICTARDARSKLDAGASLVEVYTGFIYKGPGLAGAIVKGLDPPQDVR
jgi:dihydroorotate dehydrogenase